MNYQNQNELTKIEILSEEFIKRINDTGLTKHGGIFLLLSMVQAILKVQPSDSEEFCMKCVGVFRKYDDDSCGCDKCKKMFGEI